MNSSSRMYRLVDNEGIVRRDLPLGGPVVGLVPPMTNVDFESFEMRARSSARNHVFGLSVRPPQPERPSLIPSCDGSIGSLLMTIPVGVTSGAVGNIYTKLFETLPEQTTIVCLTN